MEYAMFKIDKKDYGFHLIFSGFIQLSEMKQWANEFGGEVQKLGGAKYGVLVDMRELKPLPKDAQEFMTQGQLAARKGGMERSAIILNDTIVMMQFKRLAYESGIYDWERYFNAKDDPSYETKAINWIKNGVDPD